MTKKEYLKLVRQIQEHNHYYYELHRPRITDDAFDALMKSLSEMEQKHPEWRTSDSPTQQVGGRPQESFQTVRHRVAMLSMDNTYSNQEILDFHERVLKNLKLSTSADLEYVVELKIDGVSISLTYHDGRLDRAVTRGDGQQGDDVTQGFESTIDRCLATHQ